MIQDSLTAALNLSRRESLRVFGDQGIDDRVICHLYNTEYADRRHQGLGEA